MFKDLSGKPPQIDIIKVNRYPFLYCFQLHGIYLSNGDKCTVEQNGALKLINIFKRKIRT